MLNYRPMVLPTPLYYAAAKGLILAVRFLLDAGAEIDKEGGPEGAALMAAARAGRLEAVRMLVDAGGKIVYNHEGVIRSAVEAARLHPKVVRWFLVERFTERRRLGN